MSVPQDGQSAGDTSQTSRSPAGSLGDSVRRPARRIQLFFPPLVIPKLQSRQTALLPLGLGYIAAVLEQDGYEVSLVDCPTEGYHTLLDIGKDRVVYGLTPEEIRERIQRFRPDAIGISCIFSSLEKRLLMIARIAKEVDPSIVVVCGGPHVSAFYSRLLRDPAIDFCVVGEGEDSVVELFRSLKEGKTPRGIDGLCYREGGAIVEQPCSRWIEDLDRLPHPARHLVDMERYFGIAEPQGLRLDGEQAVRAMQLTTSRGCPFECAYCGKDLTWGKAYRTHSARYVLNEMELLIGKYGAERFALQDDNFTADMKRAGEICDGIVERGFSITWEAPNGLGLNFLSPELLEKMKASGCDGFTIAVESANDATLRRVRKPNYTKLAPPIVKKAKELGMKVRGFFMIGFPGETREEVERTVQYARDIDLSVANFSIVTPFPGTALYRECVAAGLINEDGIDFEDFHYGAFDIPLAQVPLDELKAIRKVEWMRTMFLTKDGRFRTDHGLKRRDVLDELSKGVALLPDNPDVRAMYDAAQAYYRELSEESEGESAP